MILPSTEANPAVIVRVIDGLELQLDADGLALSGPALGLVRLTPAEALAVITFARTPGVARLAARAWLATMHTLAEQEA